MVLNGDITELPINGTNYIGWGVLKLARPKESTKWHAMRLNRLMSWQKVLNIEWDEETGQVDLVSFKRGEWENFLRNYPT